MRRTRESERNGRFSSGGPHQLQQSEASGRFTATVPQVPIFGAQGSTAALAAALSSPAGPAGAGPRDERPSMKTLGPKAQDAREGLDLRESEALTLPTIPQLDGHDDRSGDTRTIPPLSRHRRMPAPAPLSGEDNRQTVIIAAPAAPPEETWHIEEATLGQVISESSPRTLSGRVIGPLEPGALIDAKYRVVRELGRGGMGIVYLAEDVALRRSVAVKVLLPRYARDARHAERFRREARMLAAIEDENVVHIHALGDHAGLPYLVMDYVMGDTLATFLAGMQSAYEVIPLDLAFSLARQLCRALSAVHSAGIVHRDVKPGNVMVTAGPRAILMDFSLARDTHAAYSGNHMVGTPDYVAPEQIRGRQLTGTDGQRSDIYSLGVTLFETLTGQLPFQGSDSMSVLHCHLRQPPPRPSLVRTDLPASFDNVLLRALAKDPADRWPSCDDLLEALTVAYRAARGTPRRRILIAADGHNHGQALARMVGAWVPGTEVTTLQSGEAVLAEVRRYVPSLVLLDLSSSADIGPVEICAALRGDPATARVPVVVMANGDSRETQDWGFLRMLGARAVVNKPVDPVRLAALVRVVVSGDAASALT